MSKEGFDNEEIIREYLNGKKFSNVNSNWQNFIKELFGNVSNNEIIVCLKKAGQNKSDLMITIGKNSKTMSVKSGTGNSVHQEPIEDFIAFLKETYSIKENLANDLRFFIWGDQTLNGNGSKKNRISAPEFVKKYPEIIQRIKAFFKEHKKDLIERFVITGSKSKSTPDYIYYGNVNQGVWKKTNEVLDYLCDDLNESNGAIPVGTLTFQAWNRNINGGNKSEHKRGVIQLKWGSVGEDLKSLFNLQI